MSREDAPRNWIELHNYRSQRVPVDANHISSMVFNANYDYTQVYLIGGQMLEIRESVDEIMSLINDVYSGAKR